MNRKAQQPRKGLVALLCLRKSPLAAAAFMVMAAASGIAKAETKSCGSVVGLWPDGAPQCLDGATPGTDGTTACCCRQSPPSVDPEVWTGECTLVKGGLIVRTKGTRLDHADGRRELVDGVAVVETDPSWLGGSVVKPFKLELLGGAELRTSGRANAVLAPDGFSLGLRAEAGQAMLSHRLRAVAPLVLQPGQEATLDPADPETWAQARVEGDAGCSAQPRQTGELPQALLVALAVLLARRQRRRRGIT